jgi:formylglycine-generating enzyme
MSVRTTDMITIAGGRFRMGADDAYPEEAPTHWVEVDSFQIDVTPVTNAQFRAFVDATGHVTGAEIAPTLEEYPDALPGMLRPGSLVFLKSDRPIPTDDWSKWWEFRFGADWRHPYGPESSIEGLDDHPVVHVNYSDAEAYAAWAGKSLPTEAEFEYAARGGLDGATYAWGDVFRPDGKHMANTWQGRFPYENTKEDGWETTSQVGSFPPNGYGLLDMIGNVWEWTQDWYTPCHEADSAKACCVPKNPRGPQQGPIDPFGYAPQKVLKGGSFLCAPSYCKRYRPAARHAEPVDTSTCHVGFRCVVRTNNP